MMQKGYVIFVAREDVVIWYLKYIFLYKSILCELKICRNDNMLVCKNCVDFHSSNVYLVEVKLLPQFLYLQKIYLIIQLDIITECKYKPNLNNLQLNKLQYLGFDTDKMDKSCHQKFSIFLAELI